MNLSRGEYIKKRRQELDMSQEELAKKIKTTQAQVSKWENGQMPKFDNIENLALALQVSLPLFIKKVGYTECFTEQEEDKEKQKNNNYVSSPDTYKNSSRYNEQYKEKIIEEIKEIKERIEKLEKEKLSPSPPGTLPVSGFYKNKCPLISGSASCGTPFSITDNCIEDYIYYPPDIEADFAIYARGYSMVEHGIVPGSVCFIKKEQPQSGAIAAICVYDGEETYPVLKVVKYKNGTPEFFDGKGEKVFLGKNVDFEIIGKVMGMVTIPDRKQTR